MAFDFKKDFASRVAKNPQYDSWVKAIGSKDDDVNDAYFYAFKDAYEKNGFKPTEDNIRDELYDRYWGLADSFKDGRGYSDGYWDRGGYDEFMEKYGSEDDFISKGLMAHAGELGQKEEDDFSKGLRKGFGMVTWDDVEPAIYHTPGIPAPSEIGFDGWMHGFESKRDAMKTADFIARKFGLETRIEQDGESWKVKAEGLD